MGQGNLGLELRSKGFMNFRNEMILPRHVRILGLELGVKGMDPLETSLYYGDPREFRIRIEVQGDPWVHEF
jgi:hypothetical protein